MAATHLHFKKTRLAPTPSGFLHLGNIFSFAITRAIAQQTGARLLLRIDDIDRERIRPEYLADIFETLQFLGFRCDEGPNDAADFNRSWSQTLRMTLYERALQQLVDANQVFACTCSRTDLQRADQESGCAGNCHERNIPLQQEGVSWRLHTDNKVDLLVRNSSGNVIQTTLPASMQEFVLRKKDRMPAYQLTSLIDDLHFGTDLIVRGEDLWPSTLAQHYLARVLDAAAFTSCTFLHHRLLHTGNGEKISKSAGDTSIRSLRQQGYNAADILTLSGFEKDLPGYLV